MQSTTYYVIRDSHFANLTDILPVSEEVLDELEELAQLTPGDEDYAKVYDKAVEAQDFTEFIAPLLKVCLAHHSEQTGRDPINIIQWNSPDSTLYFLLRGQEMVEMDDALSAYASNGVSLDQCKEIFMELDGLFEPLEETAPALVRTLRFGIDDLNEDEEHSQELMDVISRLMSDSSAQQVYVLQWTE